MIKVTWKKSWLSAVSFFWCLADAEWVRMRCLHILQADILERTLCGNVFISFCCIISLMNPDSLTASFSKGFSSAPLGGYFRLHTDSQEEFCWARWMEILSPSSLIDGVLSISQTSVGVGQCEHAGWSHVRTPNKSQTPTTNPLTSAAFELLPCPAM